MFFSGAKNKEIGESQDLPPTPPQAEKISEENKRVTSGSAANLLSVLIGYTFTVKLTQGTIFTTEMCGLSHMLTRDISLTTPFLRLLIPRGTLTSRSFAVFLASFRFFSRVLAGQDSARL